MPYTLEESLANISIETFYQYNSLFIPYVLSSQNKFFELLDPEYGPDIAEDEIFRSSCDSFHMDLHDLGLDPIQTDLKSN